MNEPFVDPDEAFRKSIDPDGVLKGLGCVMRFREIKPMQMKPSLNGKPPFGHQY
jgi:hypothetical protein